jgi:hypothetical protein
MKNCYSIATIAAILACTCQHAANADPYPLEYFALREVVSNVEISPDGERVAMLKILSRDGDPILHVYDTSDLTKDPLVVDSDPMELRSYGWVSDTDIVMVLRQRMRSKIDGQNQGVFAFKIALLNVVDKEFSDFHSESPQVENILVHEQNKIIISVQPGLDDNLNLREAYRPRAYYKLDLHKGSKELILRGKLSMGQISFDEYGNPQTGRGFDRGTAEYVEYYREPGEKEWNEIHRQHEDNFEDFQAFGKDEAVPGNLIVLANNGQDKTALYSYNWRTKSYDEEIYRRSDVDLAGVRYDSHQWTHPDRIVGVAYYKDKLHIEYFDEVEGATYAQLERPVLSCSSS